MKYKHLPYLLAKEYGWDDDTVKRYFFSGPSYIEAADCLNQEMTESDAKKLMEMFKQAFETGKCPELERFSKEDDARMAARCQRQ